ncbi:hypothetical protein VNO77_04135 [Canavalia gladiata]|uniref:Uncharacterized protein n=1 Tax=Canavalia gladiata TaxID=3824 RepID=A0AAN9MWN5_CANGL
MSATLTCKNLHNSADHRIALARQSPPTIECIKFRHLIPLVQARSSPWLDVDMAYFQYSLIFHFHAFALPSLQLHPKRDRKKKEKGNRKHLPVCRIDEPQASVWVKADSDQDNFSREDPAKRIPKISLEQQGEASEPSKNSRDCDPNSGGSRSWEDLSQLPQHKTSSLLVPQSFSLSSSISSPGIKKGLPFFSMAYSLRVFPPNPRAFEREESPSKTIFAF